MILFVSVKTDWIFSFSPALTFAQTEIQDVILEMMRLFSYLIGFKSVDVYTKEVSNRATISDKNFEMKILCEHKFYLFDDSEKNFAKVLSKKVPNSLYILLLFGKLP